MKLRYPFFAILAVAFLYFFRVVESVPVQGGFSKTEMNIFGDTTSVSFCTENPYTYGDIFCEVKK